MKKEQKKICRPVWELQLKQTTPLASPMCIVQAQGGGDKTYKKRVPRRSEASSLGLAPPHTSRVYYPLLNKTLSCTWAIILVCHFKSLLWWDRTKEITHSHNISVKMFNKLRLKIAKSDLSFLLKISNSVLTRWLFCLEIIAKKRALYHWMSQLC